jgi:predicted metal-dependent hydrolase
MNTFHYGSFSFDWLFEEATIKEHTITVEKGEPVLLRGTLVSLEKQKKMIQKRARWIRDQITAMSLIKEDDIVSGSRIKYLGRHYMVVIKLSEKQKGAKVHFNGHKFLLTINTSLEHQQEPIQKAFDRFFKQKAEEKLYPRIKYWEAQTGFSSSGVKLFRFPARWASCSREGVLEFHPRCMELAPKVLDYVIVHELAHTIEMNHTKKFWKLVNEQFPEWEECHKRLNWEL